MNTNPGRARDWLAQADNDFTWGEDSHGKGHFAQTCFVAQQVAEKALKALAFLRGYESVRGHSVVEIARSLGINDEILDAGRRLDQYYVTSRYPDALPAGAPFEMFIEDQSKEALELAQRVLARVHAEFASESS